MWHVFISALSIERKLGEMHYKNSILIIIETKEIEFGYTLSLSVLSKLLLKKTREVLCKPTQTQTGYAYLFFLQINKILNRTTSWQFLFIQHNFWKMGCPNTAHIVGKSKYLIYNNTQIPPELCKAKYINLFKSIPATSMLFPEFTKEKLHFLQTVITHGKSQERTSQNGLGEHFMVPDRDKVRTLYKYLNLILILGKFLTLTPLCASSFYKY